MSDSQITKLAMAAALKELCREKSFDKISIANIAELCGLGRQTFYYHFQDKFELLDWIYYNEGFLHAVENIAFDNWNKQLLILLEIMERDKAFYINTIKCSPENFSDYLFHITEALFFGAIEKLDASRRVKEEDKRFIARFYAMGLSGVVVSWAREGMKMPPAVLAAHLKELAVDTESLAFKRYVEAHQQGD